MQGHSSGEVLKGQEIGSTLQETQGRLLSLRCRRGGQSCKLPGILDKPVVCKWDRNQPQLVPGLPASGRAVSPEGPRWTQLGRGRRLWAQQARGLAPEPGLAGRLCDPEQAVCLYPLAVATRNGRVHHEVTASTNPVGNWGGGEGGKGWEGTGRGSLAGTLWAGGSFQRYGASGGRAPATPQPALLLCPHVRRPWPWQALPRLHRNRWTRVKSVKISSIHTSRNMSLRSWAA